MMHPQAFAQLKELLLTQYKEHTHFNFLYFFVFFFCLKLLSGTQWKIIIY